jgi:hypothetical protein
VGDIVAALLATLGGIGIESGSSEQYRHESGAGD